MSGFISSPYSLAAPVAVAGPQFVAAGVESTSIGSITPALPVGGHIADDILLLCVESLPSDTLPTAPAGYVEVTNSPQSEVSGTTNQNTRLNVFWKRDNGSESAPTVADVGDHLGGIILSFRGCTTSGNPWDTTAGGNSGGTPGVGGTITMPAVTTSVASALIVNIVGCGIDFNLANFSAWANASLVSIAEIANFGSSVGAGTGIGAACGTLTAAGSSGTTTATSSLSERCAYLTIALKA